MSALKSIELFRWKMHAVSEWKYEYYRKIQIQLLHYESNTNTCIIVTPFFDFGFEIIHFLACPIIINNLWWIGCRPFYYDHIGKNNGSQPTLFDKRDHARTSERSILMRFHWRDCDRTTRVYTVHTYMYSIINKYRATV